MELKELKRLKEKAQSDMLQLSQTSDAASAALDASDGRIASATQRVGKAQADYGRAIIMDQGVASAWEELDAAKKELLEAQEGKEAVQMVVDQCSGRATDQRRSELSQTINKLSQEIQESVVQAELEKLDPKALHVLTRAWAFDSYPGDAHGFGRWLAVRFADRSVRPELKQELIAAMRAEYKL